jgi:diguanylate cyclase (GGDEF)-like protein
MKLGRDELMRLFIPAPDMSRTRYLRKAVSFYTLFAVAASLTVTMIMELFSPNPDYTRGLIVATLVPGIIVPFLAYCHVRVIWDLQDSQRRLQDLSRNDGLTGLANRRHFMESAGGVLALARRHGHPVSLLIVDLDHFKTVNDRFGPQTGDQVLRRTASVLRRSMRGTDILARYGGEEFVALMPHTGGQEALSLCQRLRLELAEHQSRGRSGQPWVTVSIGAACSEQYGHDVGRLLAEAVQALYRAKAVGRSTYQLA